MEYILIYLMVLILKKNTSGGTPDWNRINWIKFPKQESRISKNTGQTLSLIDKGL